MPTAGTNSPRAQNAPSQQPESKSRWTTRQLVTLSLMCALAILLSFIEFPIFPSASFLKLDVSLIPAVVMGFAYGAPSGLLCGIACAVAHGIITGDWVGSLMNTIVAIVYILPASLIYMKMKNVKGAIIGLSISTVCLIVGVSAANLVIDPAFYGIPFDVVAGLIFPAIVPFNLIKGIAVSVLSVIVFKSIKGYIDAEQADYGVR